MKLETQHGFDRKLLDLIGAADDPDRLMRALESFIEYWFGKRNPENGVSEGRLDELELPMPLKRLHAFAGQWPADNHCGRLFAGGSVILLSLEELRIEGGKLVFAVECDGGPWWATSFGGKDAPVWMRQGEHGSSWQPLCESLARFLVTLCLRSAMDASRYRGYGENLTAYWQSRDQFVVPLWRDSATSYYGAASEKSVFQLAGGQILIENDCRCVTNSDLVAERFSDFLRAPPEAQSGNSPVWEYPGLPLPLQESLLRQRTRKHERLASEYEERAVKHAELAAFFRTKYNELRTHRPES